MDPPIGRCVYRIGNWESICAGNINFSHKSFSQTVEEVTGVVWNVKDRAEGQNLREAPE